jgi:hypothetical protein
MENGMHDGLEVRESRDKKIAKMQRVIQILKNIEEDNYIQMAEAELGEIIHHDWEFEETEETIDNPLGEKNEKTYRLVDKDTDEEKEHNRKVFDRTHELEEQEWAELCQIIKGQDTELFDKDKDFYKQFDGTGLRSWWD